MKQLDRLEKVLQRNKILARQYNFFKTFTTASEFLFITGTGVSIKVPEQLYPEFKSIFLRQHYLEGLVLPLPECPTIIDVGANVGFFSLFTASRWGQIFAVAPR
jgi:hypothetical protein